MTKPMGPEEIAEVHAARALDYDLGTELRLQLDAAHARIAELERKANESGIALAVGDPRNGVFVYGRPEATKAALDLFVDRDRALAAARELRAAIETCMGHRGAFSCSEQHDCRCPKSRASRHEDWKGEWVCVCGADELETVLASTAWLAAPEEP